MIGLTENQIKYLGLIDELEMLKREFERTKELDLVNEIKELKEKINKLEEEL